MNYIRKIITGIAALSLVAATAVSCDSKEKEVKDSSSEIEVVPTEPPTESPEDKAKNRTIVWLSDFSLDSQDGSESPAAVKLFRDLYGGEIEYVYTPEAEKYTALESRHNCGEPVDMFPYDEKFLPQGVLSGRFDPLDPYFDILGMEDGLWDDMSVIIDKMQYGDGHYVLPYDVSEPQLIMYSRKLFKEEKLDDPYELYQKGEWDWDAMLEMMSTFISKPDVETKRYGIAGDFGKALLVSSGSTVVNFENGKFTNNINDKNIAAAENLIKKLVDEKLYNNKRYDYYPNDNSVLFYAMGDWALGMTNAENPQGDIMVVPFPKNPDAEEHYISCEYDARLLTRWAPNPEAVAAYIKCERMAAVEEKYKELEKAVLSVKEKDAYDKWKPFIKTEQYDAVQSYLEYVKTNPYFDFSYGMSEKMYGSGDFTYESRGVVNNIAESFLRGENAAEKWDKIRDDMTVKIDEEIKRFNEQ